MATGYLRQANVCNEKRKSEYGSNVGEKAESETRQLSGNISLLCGRTAAPLQRRLTHNGKVTLLGQSAPGDRAQLPASRSTARRNADRHRQCWWPPCPEAPMRRPEPARSRLQNVCIKTPRRNPARHTGPDRLLCSDQRLTSGSAAVVLSEQAAGRLAIPWSRVRRALTQTPY